MQDSRDGRVGCRPEAARDRGVMPRLRRVCLVAAVATATAFAATVPGNAAEPERCEASGPRDGDAARRYGYQHRGGVRESRV